MPALQWFKTQVREGKTLVFDPLRKKYCVLTPEEEVRQKVLYLLVECLGVPAGLVAVEHAIKVNGLDKRCDAVVFDRNGLPLMIVECKASSVTLSSNFGSKRPSSFFTLTHLRNRMPAHLPSCVTTSVWPQPAWISMPSAWQSSWSSAPMGISSQDSRQ